MATVPALDWRLRDELLRNLPVGAALRVINQYRDLSGASIDQLWTGKKVIKLRNIEMQANNIFMIEVADESGNTKMFKGDNLTCEVVEALEKL